MQLTQAISERIHVLRTILIIGIVWLHVPPSIQFPSNLAFSSEPLLWLKLLSEKTFFRASVPTLSIISGFLFFTSKKTYFKQVTSKCQSLIVPFLLWNIPLVFALWSMQCFLGIGQSFSVQLHPFNLQVWADAVLALQSNPLNFPLGFLRDLFMCALLSPLLLVALNKFRWIGLALLFAMVIGLVPQFAVLRPTILLGFYLGGWLAIHNTNLSLIDRYASFWVTLFAISCVWVTFKACWAFHDPSSQGLGQSINLLRLVGIPGFWALSHLLVNTQVGRLCIQFSPHTFFLFCIHGPILVASWVFWQIFVGGESQPSYMVYFTLACPLTVIVGWLLEHTVLAFFPALYHVCTGQRHDTVPKKSIFSYH